MHRPQDLDRSVDSWVKGNPIRPFQLTSCTTPATSSPPPSATPTASEPSAEWGPLALHAGHFVVVVAPFPVVLLTVPVCMEQPQKTYIFRKGNKCAHTLHIVLLQTTAWIQYGVMTSQTDLWGHSWHLEGGGRVRSVCCCSWRLSVPSGPQTSLQSSGEPISACCLITDDKIFKN